MTFIEQIFGVTPDNGSGTLEFFLFALPLMIICLLFWARSLDGKGKSK